MAQTEGVGMTAKKTAIKAVDKNTCYDVKGRITKLMRRIGNGEFGEVTDAVVILRYKINGKVHIQPCVMGKSQPEVYTCMAVRAMVEFSS